jgi:alcohol dehydrogenase class IV
VNASFQYYLPTALHYGENRLDRLGGDVAERAPDKARIVLITDPGVVAAGLSEAVVAPLEAEGVAVEVFQGVESNPTDRNVDGAAAAMRAFEPHGVIGLGGGSPLDVAKLAAVVSSDAVPALSFALDARPLPPKRCFTIMIPTTAGTGAELTRTVIYSDAKGRKLWGWGQCLAPDVALLDPRMTLTLPPRLTAATAFDALVHAIEACTHCDSSPVVQAMGLQSIRMIARRLPGVLEHPADLEGRGELAVAAALAGMAIDQAGCGIAHAMGHALTSLAGVHHGLAVALVLRAAFGWNAEAEVPTHADIARALGAADTGQPEAALALEGAEAYEGLFRRSGLNGSLAAQGLGEAHVPELVALTRSPENWVMCQTSCRLPEEADLERIARRVLTAG